ncbi:MAG TPA: hypothetical protein O0X42_02755 [Methanocorpusculum sp.]|nr:hypothetical protein [Methanocorpusculum sp.]
MRRDSGVSEAVSFIFVLVIVLLLISGFLLYGVPYIEDKKSSAESDTVCQQFSALVLMMDELVLTESYGVERNAVIPSKYGTLMVSSGGNGSFSLIYDSVSAEDVVFEDGTLSCGEYTSLSTAGYMPAADSADTVVQKNTAVLSIVLLRTYIENGMTYAEFSVRLV